MEDDPALVCPLGISVNDGIDKDQFPIQYSTVDDKLRRRGSHGEGRPPSSFQNGPCVSS